MRNRNAKPQLQIPKACPKCRGKVCRDISYEHGRVVEAWKCPICGHHSDSGGFYDAIRKDTVAA